MAKGKTKPADKKEDAEPIVKDEAIEKTEEIGDFGKPLEKVKENLKSVGAIVLPTNVGASILTGEIIKLLEKK